MSGFVAIVNLDGAPVDQELLQRMTAFMDYRGPDRQAIWFDGSVGLGHTLLRTTFEAEHERQPCSLDHQIWISADARIDDQATLKQKLNDKACIDLERVTDAELILHAYAVWGTDCPQHLLGDFSCVIWDSRTRRVFCARDRFGIKLLYYARIANCLVISNTLNCLRLHPCISTRLNEQVIGDFLLYAQNLEATATAFADIQRLAAAHCLTLVDGQLYRQRYWSVSAADPIHYRQPQDYVEHFKTLLTTAVADRIRSDRVAVQMSGGLDSSSIAVLAQQLGSGSIRPLQLRAHTVVYDRLFPDQERYYAGLVGERFGLPVDFLVADDYPLFARREETQFCRPEPMESSLLGLTMTVYEQLQEYTRVVLTGWDADSLLNYGIQPYFGQVLKQFGGWHFMRDVFHYCQTQGHLPALGLRTWIKRKLHLYSPWFQDDFYPGPWLNDAFATRCQLYERWTQMNPYTWPYEQHIQAHALWGLTAPWMPDHFLDFDAGVNQFPLEFRHPFTDLRLLNYLLAIPMVPWCMNKFILRQALQGVMPEPVRTRPKSPLGGNPHSARLRYFGQNWVTDFDLTPQLADFVKISVIKKIDLTEDDFFTWLQLFPFSLNVWLKSIA